jgi:hypothetical protein
VHISTTVTIEFLARHFPRPRLEAPLPPDRFQTAWSPPAKRSRAKSSCRASRCGGRHSSSTRARRKVPTHRGSGRERGSDSDGLRPRAIPRRSAAPRSPRRRRVRAITVHRSCAMRCPCTKGRAPHNVQQRCTGMGHGASGSKGGRAVHASSSGADAAARNAVRLSIDVGGDGGSTASPVSCCHPNSPLTSAAIAWGPPAPHLPR